MFRCSKSSDGFEMHLRPRLTAAAHSELESILSILQGIQLQDRQDTRLMSSTRKPFNTKDAYAALAPSPSVQDLHGRWIWKSRVPNKVKFFAWLYFKDRLSTKSNLFHEHVLDNSVCQRCSHPIEDRCHVFFNCPLSKEVWRSIGMPTLSESRGH